MESFSQQLEKDKSSYFDRLRRFLEDTGVDQHGKDTEIICMRALSLAETAREELMQKLPLCTVYDSNKINTTSSTDDRYAEKGGGYQACMKMLHDMHVRLHAAMLQQTSERVHQKDELHGLCTDAALVAQEFSVCLIDHMQEALLALLAQKKHQVQTWQSTIVRLCYKEMNACDTIIENKISKAYDIGGAMEHAIRQGIQDRLQLEQDVISAVSNEINQRTEQTKTRLAAIKTMRKEIYEKRASFISRIWAVLVVYSTASLKLLLMQNAQSEDTRRTSNAKNMYCKRCADHKRTIKIRYVPIKSAW